MKKMINRYSYNMASIILKRCAATLLACLATNIFANAEEWKPSEEFVRHVEDGLELPGGALAIKSYI